MKKVREAAKKCLFQCPSPTKTPPPPSYHPSRSVIFKLPKMFRKWFWKNCLWKMRTTSKNTFLKINKFFCRSVLDPPPALRSIPKKNLYSGHYIFYNSFCVRRLSGTWSTTWTGRSTRPAGSSSSTPGRLQSAQTPTSRGKGTQIYMLLLYFKY